MGQYTYGAQLANLEARVPPTLHRLPEALLEITTPLRGQVWAQELAEHPDREFANYVTNGITNGFRVGFDRTSVLHSCSGNMKSALEHPKVVSDYLDQEKALNRMVVVSQEELPYINCHISPFGVIPKKSKPGHWRLIVDLSSPENASVNSGIDKDMCSVSYVTLDKIVDQIIDLGLGTLMAKVDIKQAYRIIPVHPDDRYLLGVQWQGEVLLDKVLPFGLRSAPIIFTAVVDALQWIMVKRGVRNVSHYLDDFITLGRQGSEVCQQNLDGIITTCEHTGTPLEVDKCEGPTPTITFLGLELDTVNMEIRLPAAKLARLQSLLKEWEGKRAGKKRDLLSLIGYLHHASKAVRQGRSFLRWLINLFMAVKPLDGYIRLNLAARSDIKWWSMYVAQWNGTSMMTRFDKTHPTKMVTSDASGSWGCGAFCDSLWLQLQWPASMTQCHISVKEMIPVVISAALWGHQWSGQSVHFQSDNTSVVALINSGTSREDTLMHLMRCLSFIMAKFNFVVSASHIKGSHNVLADALSRNDRKTLSNYPQAQPTPTAIPTPLLDLLIMHKPDWTSRHWTALWNNIFMQH